MTTSGFGPKHSNVATRLNNLAMLLKDTNCLTEAESLMCRALEIDVAIYGADHPDIATELNNLATLLRAANRQTEAEPLMRRSVEILLRFLATTGYHHPNEDQTIASYYDLLAEMNYTPEQIGAQLQKIALPLGLSF